MPALRILLVTYGMLLCRCVLPLAAQDIDSISPAGKRIPASIASEIGDPAERRAFIALSETNDSKEILRRAQYFLNAYPSSAFLAPVAEAAARTSFDLGQFQSGLGYSHLALALWPENAQLLALVADAQAFLQQNLAAITSARDALDYFDRFDRPATVSERDWPAKKRKMQATAWFAMGRARSNQALQANDGAERRTLLNQAVSALSRARSLSPQNMQVAYFLGVDYFFAGDLRRAAVEFAAVSQQGGELAAQARERLMAVYKATKPAPTDSFETFAALLESRAEMVPAPLIEAASAPADKLPGYAGSAACRACHEDIHKQWSQSGMAKMLRPYAPENILGDFTKNNQFYAGDDVAYSGDGGLKISPGAKRVLFARMELRGGRHWFDIKQADGRWQAYPVDYTIGSKWQQAYATTLPDGEIHVFPIQYNALDKRWIEYWKIVDAPGGERGDPWNWEKLDISTSYKANCAACHTSQLRRSSDSQGTDGSADPEKAAFREPGIDCEMCHGPSALHVQAVREGKEYKKTAADPPVEFDRINSREFVAICAQCHMQSNLHRPSPIGEMNYSSEGKFHLANLQVPFNEFPLSAFYKDGRFRQTTFIVEAMERSKCFRQGQVSCGACHNPHSHDEASNPTSLKFKDDPDRMCVGCHAQYVEPAKAAAHTRHAASSEGSRCVSCHMPRIMESMLFRSRTHQMDDIPNAEMTLRFGQKDSPNACLLCHTGKTPQWLDAQLSAWKTRP